ncbi:CFEM domain-containing protein [Fusarium sp. Ph1]|nr:CFEM domain-containing protein [Fusarium sp. Ph1]
MLFGLSLFACLLALPAGLATSSTSAALAGWPECSIKCLATAIGNSTCSAADQACMCTNEQLQLEMNVCVKQTCTVKESLATANLTMTSCGAPIRDKSNQYLILSNTFAVITGLFIVQRFASKIYWKLPLGLDDWFMLITFLSGIPSSVITVHGTVANGLGRDIWTLTPTEITNFGYFFHVMAILYFAQVTLLKLSLLFFYLRIFPTVGVRRTLWATVIFNSLFGLAFVFTAVFQCQPISYFWKKWDGEHEGHCADLNAITWSNAGISIALDFWMLAVPLSQLKALNLDWKKKIGVGMMFCVGTFVTIVSILRLRAVVKFKAQTENATWEFLEVSKWSTIEINVGMICACMPSLRILLVRLFPKILGTSRRYYPNYASNTGRNTNKNRSRQLGTNATTEVDTTSRPVESRGITYQRTYDVQYGDSDETHLVHMKDLDAKSARSGVSGVSV